MQTPQHKNRSQYKLSPSDFAYLYEECKLCYYLKVKEGLHRPPSIMPGVFSAINTLIQGDLIGKNLKELSPELPDCIVESQEKFVESIIVPETQCYIKGKYDLLCRNPDDTYTLVDLKISRPDEEKIEKYRTQLTSYKFAMENPRREEPIKITKMGLLIFYPDSVEIEHGTALMNFPPTWMEMTTDEGSFFEFLREINDLLSGKKPEPNSDCKNCEYYDSRQQHEE